ncbi:hypothetical protein F0310_04535 (plasmid) [Borrelia sp. A-FGy1]|uniref:hypothetical protein n=1 Tax=Borrelia sp. A-FGy1 TaxID=2608247 RepID=UPI0015F3AEB0|nr:hypothetical protein [Borrelia sp. A-FGy1]QMU99685.1 hypothetical protein F0310_04535 [Borrelia sp. A-FGy1]
MRVSFSKDLPIKAQDLNKIKANFDANFGKLNARKIYGKIIDGFSISYDSFNRKASVDGGLGFTPSGKLVRFDGIRSTNLDSVYDTSNYVHLLILKPREDEEYYPHFISYEFDGSSVFDPYSYLRKNEELYSNYLAIGFLKDGVMSDKFNRVCNEPTSPVGSLFLYEKSDFVDYITLRGCKIIKGFDTRYLKCINASSVSKKSAVNKGGRSSFILETRHIPTLEVEGETDEKGSHTHSYTNYTKYRNRDPEYRSDYYYNLIRNISSTVSTSYEGSHRHKVYPLEYENLHPDAIKLTPKCRNLALIERMY